MVFMAACHTSPSQPPPEPKESTVIVPQSETPPEPPPLVVVPPMAPKPPKLISRRFPESTLTAPELDRAPGRVEYQNRVSSRQQERKQAHGWKYREDRAGRVVGFEFSNHGGNPILPPHYDGSKNLFYTRDFQFRYEGRARQDIHLIVSDWVPSYNQGFRLSGILNSIWLFFPRRFLPAIVQDGDRTILTLPTGEDVIFDSRSFEIIGGVLEESPVDLSHDRNKRQFPAIKYTGEGLWLRADSRGSDPRISTVALIGVGANHPSCRNGDCNICKIPAQELWQQTGAANFKFATDHDWGRHLHQRCNLAIPDVTPRSTANELSARQ